MDRGRGLRVTLFVLVVGASACSGGDSQPTVAQVPSGVPTIQSSIGGPSAADAVIDAFGGGHGADADFAALETEIRDDPDGLRAAALGHLGDSSATAHYAAVYALARTVTDGQSTTALRGLLSSEAVDDRLLAAGALIYRGDSSAIPVFISELGSTDTMAYRDPPMTAWQFARLQLLRFTDQDLGLRAVSYAAGAAQVKAQWQRWWDDHGADLSWAAATEEFH